ncbi:MAG TPA: M48 family metallopeptidase [Usitatibacter sp.]|nr:M48 family metallopeptidase [Usitatibacter sp.]
MATSAEAIDAHPVDVDSLVYAHERSLFVIHVLLASLFWLLVVVGTLGIALVYVLFIFLGYLFAQSALIAWIRGNGVRITAQQFPDLHARYVHCCQALGMIDPPGAYLLNGQGVLNAFATKFLGRYFVVLNSNVVDALGDRPEAINFYMGHELAHVRRKHLLWHPYIWPATILPLIGAGYSRAREYTCDAFGRACCANPEPAVQGLVALAAGEKRWAQVSLPAYFEQMKDTSGFWMSFHELVADYPWIVKRVARIASPSEPAPSRNPFAWLFALFVPRLGVGGGAGGMMIVVAIIGILAAIAIPAYQDYTVRARMTDVVNTGQRASDAVGSYYDERKTIPQTLEAAGFASTSPSVRQVEVNQRNGVVKVTVAFPPLDGKTLLFVPSLDENKHIKWRCTSQDILPKYLPLRCR